MTAWLRIQNPRVEPWAMSVVHNPREATRLSSANAQQAAIGAQQRFVEYQWVPVPSFPGEMWIVEGWAKPGKK
jgi:hypothetical protein